MAPFEDLRGVLGMIISDKRDTKAATKKFRVSIREEATPQYVTGTPQLGLYRAYKYTPGNKAFNIQKFIKSGTNGSETLVGVPKPSPTNSIKEVIVYTCLDHTPLLIYYGDGQTTTNTHHWYKNTGKDNTWASADIGSITPPTTQDITKVRKALEEVNCTVNGVVQIDVSQHGEQTVPYCHKTHTGGDHSSNYKIKVSPKNATDYGLQKSPDQYTVYEHTPHGSPTLTISAFKNATRYLNGVGGSPTTTYLTGVTRV